MQSYIDKLEETGNYKVIKRFESVSEYNEGSSNIDGIKMGIYLDIEATGMNIHSDKIIELAMVPFEYDSLGNIYKVLPEYCEFQDPGMPISDFITKLTGITDEMVAGKSLDLEKISSMLSKASIVIAHNARFDRPFSETLLDDFKNIHWGCSINDINWNEEGLDGVKLSYLAYRYGFFYESHRASTDCQAGIELLSRNLLNSGGNVFKRLLDNAEKLELRLYAERSPFDKKDILKERGYRWSPGENGRRKAWYIDLDEKDIEIELDFLKESIYERKEINLPMDKIDGKVRYSNRL